MKPPIILPPTWIHEDFEFPDPTVADEDGLVAIGGNLRPKSLIRAYSQGIFPWRGAPPVWYSPDPRGIIEIQNFHIGRSFRRTLRQTPFDVSIDRAFEDVILACSVAHGETWIDDALREAYVGLHRAGFAHSIEVWDGSELVGGLYGVAIHGLFAGESMFHARPNASKIALYYLNERLQSRGYTLFDIQMITPATEAVGAIEISRDEYVRRLRQAMSLDCHFL